MELEHSMIAVQHGNNPGHGNRRRFVKETLRFFAGSESLPSSSSVKRQASSIKHQASSVKRQIPGPIVPSRPQYSLAKD